MSAEAPDSRLGLFTVVGLIDRLGVGLDLLVITLFDFVGKIAHLVHPATLMQSPGINRLDRSPQPRTAVSHYQLQMFAL